MTNSKRSSSEDIYSGAECPKCKYRWIETKIYRTNEKIICPKCSWGKKTDLSDQFT